LSYLRWSIPSPYSTKPPPSPGLVVLAAQSRSPGAMRLIPAFNLHPSYIPRIISRKPAPRLNERQCVQLKHLVWVPSSDYCSHLMLPFSTSATVLLIDNTLSVSINVSINCWSSNSLWHSDEQLVATTRRSSGRGRRHAGTDVSVGGCRRILLAQRGCAC
jgi:hypothetical protein